ncbi:hypothetical protein [Pandoraea sp. NPDC090278]|uniref:hypothetical protein n=1 Tax=Pandoraea sp. NPDC090278 TaxID=3364391 RepID=UPI00383A351F
MRRIFSSNSPYIPFSFVFLLYFFTSFFYIELGKGSALLSFMVFMSAVTAGAVFIALGHRRRGFSYIAAGMTLILMTIFDSSVYHEILQLRQRTQFYLFESHYKSQSSDGYGEWDWGMEGTQHYLLVYDESHLLRSWQNVNRDEAHCTVNVKKLGGDFYVIKEWCPGIFG